MAEYAIWKSGQVESLVILSVRLRLRPLRGPVVKRHDTSPTCWKRWFNSIRDHSRSWSVGVSAARRLGRAEDRVQFPDGPLCVNGPVVQREDAGMAFRKSGFNSRWVHLMSYGR